MPERRPNAQRSRETRGKILWAARQLFAEKGYAAASTPAIVTAAKVTRGAMYHHFPDKAAVFAGVVNAELADVGQRMGKASQTNPDPVEQLILGGEAYVLAMAEPGRRRILLVEGASVLGTERIEALRGQHLKAKLEAGLRQIVAAGIVPELPVAPLADLLAALFDRVALTADRESFPGYRLALRALIGGLKLPPPAAGDFVLG
ncbi:TetR/AcrR family transcriptional regulator [Caulobacter sp. NIBR1757]|uniref:TetR/AcrR family transcriptional regulator n=1 Tax=Caulobacter sp. NIBR1757 TaxID=3016000 RepID=UPI0022F039D0|nr:TetR/AcrR family transcriptional regulator [Caulobacter sp. NIBR1757]WGM37350.1 Transposon Tn10 TetC protein [Caulobacter sp. NIBR1757]